jgi:hypothetical protein
MNSTTIITTIPTTTTETTIIIPSTTTSTSTSEIIYWRFSHTLLAKILGTEKAIYSVEILLNGKSTFISILKSFFWLFFIAMTVSIVCLLGLLELVPLEVHCISCILATIWVASMSSITFDLHICKILFRDPATWATTILSWVFCISVCIILDWNIRALFLMPQFVLTYITGQAFDAAPFETRALIGIPAMFAALAVTAVVLITINLGLYNYQLSHPVIYRIENIIAGQRFPLEITAYSTLTDSGIAMMTLFSVDIIIRLRNRKHGTLRFIQSSVRGINHPNDLNPIDVRYLKLCGLV